MRFFWMILPFAVFAYSPSVFAIFKCVVDGEVTYSASPCAEDAKEMDNLRYVPSSKLAKPKADQPAEDKGEGDAPTLDDGTGADSDIGSVKEGDPVTVGMTPKQVRVAWGEPVQIGKTRTSKVQKEQWVYNRPEGRRLVYISEGKVISVR